ncbi:MAG: DUF2807 domain-containing protein [Bacteroidota bacterium]
MVLIVALTILWILSIVSFFYALPFGSYFIGDSKIYAFMGLANIFVLIGVPILSLILAISRLAFRAKRRPKLSTGLWVFWGINLISLVTMGSFTAREFSDEQTIEISNAVDRITSDTIDVDFMPKDYSHGSKRFGPFQFTNNYMLNNDVELFVIKSKTGKFELTQQQYSRGRNATEASYYAGEINCEPIIMDNKITIPRNFQIQKGNKWRGQNVLLTLTVPEGKTIRLGRHAAGRLHHIDIDRNKEYPWPYQGQTWTMESEGMVSHEYIAKNNKSSEFPFDNFEELQIEGKMKVSIEKGDNFQVRITGKEVYTKKVDITQLNQALIITADLKKSNSPVRLFITMPSLKKLDAEHTDDIKIKGFDEPRMSIRNEGRYDIKALINVDSLYLRQDGRHEVDLRGNGRYLEVALNERARLDAERFTVNDAKVSAKYHSTAKVAANNTLHVEHDSNSKVRNDGGATITEDIIKKKK